MDAEKLGKKYVEDHNAEIKKQMKLEGYDEQTAGRVVGQMIDRVMTHKVNDYGELTSPIDGLRVDENPTTRTTAAIFMNRTFYVNFNARFRYVLFEHANIKEGRHCFDDAHSLAPGVMATYRDDCYLVAVLNKRHVIDQIARFAGAHRVDGTIAYAITRAMESITGLASASYNNYLFFNPTWIIEKGGTVDLAVNTDAVNLRIRLTADPDVLRPKVPANRMVETFLEFDKSMKTLGKLKDLISAMNKNIIISRLREMVDAGARLEFIVNSAPYLRNPYESMKRRGELQSVQYLLNHRAKVRSGFKKKGKVKLDTLTKKIYNPFDEFVTKNINAVWTTHEHTGVGIANTRAFAEVEQAILEGVRMMEEANIAGINPEFGNNNGNA